MKIPQILTLIRRYAFCTEFLSDFVTADSYSLPYYVPIDVLWSYRIAV